MEMAFAITKGNWSLDALLPSMSRKLADRREIATQVVSFSAHHLAPAFFSKTIQMHSTSLVSSSASICSTKPQAPFTRPSCTSMLCLSMTLTPTAIFSKASKPPVFSGSAQTTSAGSGAPVLMLVSSEGHS